MKDIDIQLFGLIKEKITTRMQQCYPGINPCISEWKGQEIMDFQEELLNKVHAHISEKWFYNHVKSRNQTLPRIDILNLLSKYAGYANWDDFRYKNSDKVAAIDPTKSANRYFIFIPFLVIVILGVLFVFFKMLSTKNYTFRFFDTDTKEPVTNNFIEINVLRDGESPVSYFCGADGSFTLKTDKANVHFVVKAPCYQTDTIVRILDKFNPHEIVQLRPDNYALMIQYFSNMNVKDWKKRRDLLNKMISDSAMIYQVFSKSGLGVELFNKSEFINKLTLPSSSLKAIEILETKYQSDRISVVRFRQKETIK